MSKFGKLKSKENRFPNSAPYRCVIYHPPDNERSFHFFEIVPVLAIEGNLKMVDSTLQSAANPFTGGGYFSPRAKMVKRHPSQFLF